MKTELKAPTVEELLKIVTEFSTEHKVEVFQEIDLVEEGLKVDIDEGFITEFENKFPGVDMNLVMQDFFTTILGEFVAKAEEDPEFMKEFEENIKDSTKVPGV